MKWGNERRRRRFFFLAESDRKKMRHNPRPPQSDVSSRRSSVLSYGTGLSGANVANNSNRRASSISGSSLPSQQQQHQQSSQQREQRKSVVAPNPAEAFSAFPDVTARVRHAGESEASRSTSATTSVQAGTRTLCGVGSAANDQQENACESRETNGTLETRTRLGARHVRRGFAREGIQARRCKSVTARANEQIGRRAAGTQRLPFCHRSHARDSCRELRSEQSLCSEARP